MMLSPSGRPMSFEASTPTSKCCSGGPSMTPGECPKELDLCPNAVVHQPLEPSAPKVCSGRARRPLWPGRTGSGDHDRCSERHPMVLGPWWRAAWELTELPSTPLSQCVLSPRSDSRNRRRDTVDFAQERRHPWNGRIDRKVGSLPEGRVAQTAQGPKIIMGQSSAPEISIRSSKMGGQSAEMGIYWN
jgi:hypothetical protein